MKPEMSEEHTHPEVVWLAGDAVTSKNGRTVLVGQRCNECGTLAFPRVPVCSDCLSESFTREIMPECGVLYSWTAVHVGPQRMNKPVLLGYVDFENGVRVFTHLSAKERALVIGQPVQIATDQVGTEVDGRPIKTFVFMPAGDEK